MASNLDIAIKIATDTSKALNPLNAVTGALGGLGKAATAPIHAIGGLTDVLGKVGLAGMGIQTVIGSVTGLGDALGFGLANQMEQATASFNAFTKDSAKSAEIIAQVRDEAAKTPFTFQEMTMAAAGLLPVTKASGESLQNLLKDAEVLSASNPMQGFEGAVFSLREAVTGDFTSIIERFNLSRSTINKLKAEGVPNLEIVRKAMLEMGFDQDLVSAKAETLEGRFSTFTDTIDNLKLKIATPIFDATKEGLIALGSVLEDNMPALESFADLLAGGFKKGLDIVKTAFTGIQGLIAAFTTDVGGMGIVLDSIRKIFGDTVADAIEPFIQGFMKAIPQIKEFAGLVMERIQIVGQIVGKVLGGDLSGAFDLFRGALMDNTQAITSILGEWAGAFLSWIEPMIPPLLAKLGELLRQVGDWLLNTALPAIKEQLVVWGAAFVDWVGDTAPSLVTALADMGTKMLDQVGATGDDLDAATKDQWADAMVDWITVAIPHFIEKFGTFAEAFMTAIDRLEEAAKMAIFRVGINIGDRLRSALLEQAKKIYESALEIGTTIIANIVTNVTDGVSRFVELLTAIRTWMTQDAIPWVQRELPKFGESMVSAIVSGLSGLGGALQKAVDDAWSSLSKGFTAGFSQRGPTAGSGGFLTVPQFGNAIRSLGFNEQTIAAICGPIAATGMANGIGRAMSLIDVEDISRRIGAYAPGFGTRGPGAFQQILKAIGIDSHSSGFQDAVTAAMAGIPVAISTPLHYFLAQGFDQATQKFIVGNTGTALKGGFEAMTRSAIEALAGPIQTFIIPTLQRGGELISDAFMTPIISATTALDTLTRGAGSGFHAVGESVTAFGRAVRAALGEQAVPALEAVTESVVQLSGQDQLWDMIRNNASVTGRDLSTFLKDVGASAIDKSTASLQELQAASGLSLPQVQKMAGEAGRDVRAWLLTVGVPAAEALRDSLKNTSEATTALSIDTKALKDPVDTAKNALTDMRNQGLLESRDATTQVSAVLLQLRDGLIGEGAYSGKGLIKAIRDFTDALNAIPREINVHINTGMPNGVRSLGAAAGGVAGLPSLPPANTAGYRSMAANGELIDYDRMGAAIARELAKVQLAVGVNDVQSALLRYQRRNVSTGIA